MLPKTRLIEIITLLFIYCLSVNNTIQEELLYQKACFNTFNHTYCEEIFDCKNKTSCGDAQTTIQKSSSKWGIYLTLAQNIPSLIVTLIFGVCSDKIGRRTFLLIPLIGYIISCATFGLISHFNTHIYYLFIGEFIGGCFGGYYAFLSSCFSYIADISSEEKRTFRVVFLEAMINLAGVMGSLTGSIIVANMGFLAVYMMLCGVYVLQVIYWFFLEETNKKEETQKNEEREWKFSINYVFDKGLKAQFGIFSSHRRPHFRRYLLLAMFSFFMGTFCVVGIARSQYKYVMHEPLNFSAKTVGYFAATSNSAVFVSTIIIDFVCIHWLRMKDSSVMFLGTLGLIGYSVSIGLSKTTLTMFLCRLWALMYGATIPSIRSMLSKMFSKLEQGKVFATIAFFDSLATLLSNLSINYIYGQTVSVSPSLVFFIMAGFAVVLLLLSLFLSIFRVDNMYLKLDEDVNDEQEENSDPSILDPTPT